MNSFGTITILNVVTGIAALALGAFISLKLGEE